MYKMWKTILFVWYVVLLCLRVSFSLKAENIKLWIYTGGSGSTESEVIAKYEIMDGLPVRGKTVVDCWLCGSFYFVYWWQFDLVVVALCIISLSSPVSIEMSDHGHLVM